MTSSTSRKLFSFFSVVPLLGIFAHPPLCPRHCSQDRLLFIYLADYSINFQFPPSPSPSQYSLANTVVSSFRPEAGVWQDGGAQKWYSPNRNRRQVAFIRHLRRRDFSGEAPISSIVDEKCLDYQFRCATLRSAEPDVLVPDAIEMLTLKRTFSPDLKCVPVDYWNLRR